MIDNICMIICSGYFMTLTIFAGFIITKKKSKNRLSVVFVACGLVMSLLLSVMLLFEVNMSIK